MDRLYGPSDLADHIVARRRDGGGHALLAGDLSDQGIRDLVQLAYHGSLATEEGAHARFRMYAPAHIVTNRERWRMVELNPPVALRSVDDLRKIAPAAASHDFALEICEEDGVLYCVAIRFAHTGDGNATLFSSSIWWSAMLPGLMIRVDGPGQLRVSDGHGRWELRDAKLQEPEAPHLDAWWDPLAQKIAGRRIPNDAFHVLVGAWQQLLLLTAERRKGGCFVVLPTDNLLGIQMKYPTSRPSLRTVIAELLDVCTPSLPTVAGAEEPFRATRRAVFEAQDRPGVRTWMWCRHAVRTTIASLATVAGVDGCTVFTYDLQLLGFGGKLPVPDPGDAAQLENVGMRHLSAFSFCRRNEGVYCYVVSQDGRISRFVHHNAQVDVKSPCWPEGGQVRPH